MLAFCDCVATEVGSLVAAGIAPIGLGQGSPAIGAKLDATSPIAGCRIPRPGSRRREPGMRQGALHGRPAGGGESKVGR